MQQVPSPDDVRAHLAPLDDLDRKVVGGLVALCMAAPGRIRDREWLAERFVQVATVALGWDDEAGPATSADVERVRAYAQRRSEALLPATLLLFVRTAEDLRARGGAPDLAAAQAIVRDYLRPADAG